MVNFKLIFTIIKRKNAKKIFIVPLNSSFKIMIQKFADFFQMVVAVNFED